MSKCPHCKPEDYPMTGTPIYGCSCKCHNPAPQTSIDEIAKLMVDRFLGWKLPEDFQPDAGISFKPNYNEDTQYENKHQPVGTNLFTATQATEMVKYMLEPAKSAIYNLLESKAVDVQQSKRTSSGNDYRTSFKAVPLERLQQLFGSKE